MTVMEFFGCTFIALGPPFALFCFTVAHDPVKVIILIASAFFWLLALLLSSLFSKLNVDIIGGPIIVSCLFSVIFQELLRFLVYILLRKAEFGLSKVTDGSTRLVDNKHILAYVSGLGFGIMSGAFSIINLLAEAVGPGTIGLRQGNDHPHFLLTSAFLTLAIILSNTAWGVILFQALDHRNWPLIAYVGVAHLSASGLTLFNVYNFYLLTITMNYFILVLSGCIAFYVSGGRWNFKKRPVTSPARVNGQGQSVLAEGPITEIEG